MFLPIEERLRKSEKNREWKSAHWWILAGNSFLCQKIIWKIRRELEREREKKIYWKKNAILILYCWSFHNWAARNQQLNHNYHRSTQPTIEIETTITMTMIHTIQFIFIRWTFYSVLNRLLFIKIPCIIHNLYEWTGVFFLLASLAWPYQRCKKM